MPASTEQAYSTGREMFAKACAGFCLLTSKVITASCLYLTPKAPQGSFRTHVEGSTVFEGRTFYYLSAYWQAYQVWMVADESRLWEKLSFEPLTRFPKQSMASTDGNCGV